MLSVEYKVESHSYGGNHCLHCVVLDVVQTTSSMMVKLVYSPSSLLWHLRWIRGRGRAAMCCWIRLWMFGGQWFQHQRLGGCNDSFKALAVFIHSHHRDNASKAPFTSFQVRLHRLRHYLTVGWLLSCRPSQLFCIGAGYLSKAAL
jgi:hypothetical protein